jgi:hypothetical protein
MASISQIEARDRMRLTAAKRRDRIELQWWHECRRLERLQLFDAQDAKRRELYRKELKSWKRIGFEFLEEKHHLEQQAMLAEVKFDRMFYIARKEFLARYHRIVRPYEEAVESSEFHSIEHAHVRCVESFARRVVADSEELFRQVVERRGTLILYLVGRHNLRLQESESRRIIGQLRLANEEWIVRQILQKKYHNIIVNWWIRMNDAARDHSLHFLERRVKDNLAQLARDMAGERVAIREREALETAPLFDDGTRSSSLRNRRQSSLRNLQRTPSSYGTAHHVVGRPGFPEALEQSFHRSSTRRASSVAFGTSFQRPQENEPPPVHSPFRHRQASMLIRDIPLDASNYEQSKSAFDHAIAFISNTSLELKTTLWEPFAVPLFADEAIMRYEHRMLEAASRSIIEKHAMTSQALLDGQELAEHFLAWPAFYEYNFRNSFVDLQRSVEALSLSTRSNDDSSVTSENLVTLLPKLNLYFFKSCMIDSDCLSLLWPSTFASRTCWRSNTGSGFSIARWTHCLEEWVKPSMKSFGANSWWSKSNGTHLSRTIAPSAYL